MQKILAVLLLSITFWSCNNSDEKFEQILSPTGRYSINVIINRSDKSKSDYTHVIVQVFEGQNKLYDFDTRSSDVQKWAIGWTLKGDTIVFQSSDIGNRAWKVDLDGPLEVDMNEELHFIAANLKTVKYEK